MEKHQLYGSRWVNVLGGEGNSIERIKVKLFSFFWVHLTLRVCIPLWFIGINLRLLLLRWPGLRGPEYGAWTTDLLPAVSFVFTGMGRVGIVMGRVGTEAALYAMRTKACYD